MEANRSELIRILLVDDDEDCRMLVKDAMRQGHIFNEVHEVDCAEKALDFLHRRGPYQEAPRIGLIYLDIQMPGMSGQELLKILRADETLSKVPIVMMTNLCDDREKEAAARAGANSYTIKPANPDQFIHTVIEATNYWIGIHKAPSVLMEEAQTATI